MAQHAHGADARKVRGRYKRGVRGEANLQRNGGFCPQALNEFAGRISRWFLNPIFSNEYASPQGLSALEKRFDRLERLHKTTGVLFMVGIVAAGVVQILKTKL